MKQISPYMLALHETLKKEKDLAEATISNYLRILYTLNGDKSFKNLAFLKNFDVVQNKLNDLAESTQKAYLAAISSVLSLNKDMAAYKKTYTHWHDKMMEMAKADANKDSAEKTEKQEANWMDWKDVLEIKKQFIFNVYKTAKTHGQQKVAIPDGLFHLIQIYLKFHPIHKGNKKFAPSFVFLVSADGSALMAVNAITRILNRVFGKKVAASMLRHIYLSDKYDVTEMKEDAEAMGHSLSQQRAYLKGDGVSDSGPKLIITEEK